MHSIFVILFLLLENKEEIEMMSFVQSNLFQVAVLHMRKGKWSQKRGGQNFSVNLQ